MSSAAVAGAGDAGAVTDSTPKEVSASAADHEDKMKTMVMYVILRRDLKWPLGSVVAQGAHASTAILWEVSATCLFQIAALR